MSPHIELATSADLDALCELEQAAFTAAAWSRAGIAGALWHPNGLALLRLAVRPAARRAGVATLLLDRSFGDLRQRGVGQVFLEVRADNEAARALYRRRGWADAGVRTGYYDDGIDAVLMSQALPVACPESSRRVPSS